MSERTAFKVLVVDDEPNVTTYLETLLQDAGYETVCAADGVEGLERARDERPDLITLDITMPRKSGIRMYREMKADPELAKIKVVVVTAVTGKGHDAHQFEHFLETRASIPPPDAFVAKPIERMAFLELVAELLG